MESPENSSNVSSTVYALSNASLAAHLPPNALTTVHSHHEDDYHSDPAPKRMETLYLCVELYTIFVFIMGVSGHILTCICLRKKIFAQGITIAFRVMSVTEVLLLLCVLPLLWTQLYFRTDLTLLERSPILCTLYASFIFICSLIVDWIVILVTAIRFVYITFPLKAKMICREANVYISIVVIVIINVGYGIILSLSVLSPQIDHSHEGPFTHETICLSIWFRQIHARDMPVRMMTSFWPLLLPAILHTVFSVRIVTLHKRLIYRELARKKTMVSTQTGREMQGSLNTCTSTLNTQLSAALLGLVAVDNPNDEEPTRWLQSTTAKVNQPAKDPIPHETAAVAAVDRDVQDSPSLTRASLLGLPPTSFDMDAGYLYHITPRDSKSASIRPRAVSWSSPTEESTTCLPVPPKNSPVNASLDGGSSKERQNRRKSIGLYLSHQWKRRSRASSITRQPLQLVVVISNIAFIIFRIPLASWVIGGDNIFRLSRLLPEPTNEELIFIIVEIMLYTHHASLFIVYCCTGRKFREELWKTVVQCVACDFLENFS